MANDLKRRNDICKNCGKERGAHRATDDACPISTARPRFASYKSGQQFVLGKPGKDPKFTL